MYLPNYYVDSLIETSTPPSSGAIQQVTVFLAAATNNVLASGSLGPAGTIDRAECDWALHCPYIPRWNSSGWFIVKKTSYHINAYLPMVVHCSCQLHRTMTLSPFTQNEGHVLFSSYWLHPPSSRYPHGFKCDTRFPLASLCSRHYISIVPVTDRYSIW